MKFSVYVITALAAATSSSCFVLATATAASRNRKFQKKTSSGATTGATGSLGQPGSSCGATSDCAVPTGLNHAVCRDGQCQSGDSGSSCGQTSDCVKPSGLDHPVCRQGTCQVGVCQDYCGNNSDCLPPLVCYGFTNIAKCQLLADDGFREDCNCDPNNYTVWC